ncbi:hypothetical protein IscW_ISCW002096, partial [Ixodes scapularis]
PRVSVTTNCSRCVSGRRVWQACVWQACPNQNLGTPAMVITVLLNGKKVLTELDTRAAVSVMSETECAKHFPHASIRKANVKLVTCIGTPVAIKEIVDVEVHYHDQCFHFPLVIAKKSEGARMPTLFGRDWLSKIKIRWHEVVQVKALAAEMIPLTEKYRHVFEPAYGKIRGFKASIRM